MKKALLLLIGLMSLMTVTAKELNAETKTSIYNRYNDAVTFIEKGVKFHVFLNGDFEFNTPYNNRRYYDYDGYRVRKNSIRIDRDFEGRIKRIGRNYIRYDFRGNVTKIGNIRIYYRNGLLRKVGNLKVSYNNWGDPYFYGQVNRYKTYNDDFHFSINIGPIFNYNDRYFYKRAIKSTRNKSYSNKKRNITPKKRVQVKKGTVKRKMNKKQERRRRS